MKTTRSISRREFVAGVAAGVTALGTSVTIGAAADRSARQRFKIIAFSKPFQNLSYDETAELVAEVGWQGIECPVRAKGQIQPERVEDELPKLVEALKKRNLEVTIITTDIRNLSQPLTSKVLRTASQLGIKRYRLSFWRYDPSLSIPAQLSTIRSELKDLVALNKELGLCAGFQNHSGADYVGAPVWDVHELIKDFDPRYIGVCFDIGHATLEGGYSWPTQARLMEPHYAAVFVKDFLWKKNPKSWRAEWCPLGEGMVNPAFFKTLLKSSFSGPISQHHEYPVGTGKEMVKALKKDLQVLQEWLS